MDGHLISVDGARHAVDAASIRSLLQSSTRFWLDLVSPSPEDQDEILRQTFGFHPLAVEDAAHFGQRPKIDNYDDYAVLVVYGANPDGRLVEVHCFYTATYLVTVHHDPCHLLGDLADRLVARGGKVDHVMLLYRVVDTLVDGFFPVLAALDDQIDDLEDAILVRPTEQQLGSLFDMKRSLIGTRKVVAPQRDMFAKILSETDSLPGMTADAERYFRDIYDHLIRISELVDSYRDLMSGALDTHLSTVSNRLNVVMKQLTIIATVFLPLSFITGFFGQNFGWMVNRLGSLGVFLGLGVGLQVAMALVLLVYFRTKGWLTSDGAPPSAGGPDGRLPRDRRWKLMHPIPSHHGSGHGAAHPDHGPFWGDREEAAAPSQN